MNDGSVPEESELRAAVQFAVIQICSKEDAQSTSQVVTSPSAMASLSELAYLYATSCLASDLEAFRDHAGRKTITENDIKLVLRKNPDGALTKLEQFLQEHQYVALLDATKESNKQSRPVNLQRKSFHWEVEEQSSQDSSTTEDMLKELKAEGGQKAPKSTATVARRVDNWLDDDSDDEVEILNTKSFKTTLAGKENRKAILDDDDDDSSDDDMNRKPKAKRKSPPTARRFLLGKHDDSSMEVEIEEVHRPDPAAVKPSAVQATLKDMSQDSIDA